MRYPPRTQREAGIARIDRPAYPHFKSGPSVLKLDALSTPADDDLRFACVIAQVPTRD